MKAINLFLISLAVLLVSCSVEKTTAPDFNSDCYDCIWPDEEAQLARLWSSGNIAADSVGYERIRNALAVLRASHFADSVFFPLHLNDNLAEATITFRPQWIESQVYLKFNPATFQQIVAGNYDAWDDLNDLYGMDSISLDLTYDYLYIHFRGRLNPMRLLDVYKDLPGLDVIRIVPRFFFDQQKVLIIDDTDHEIIKIYGVKKWGDCPSGCMYYGAAYFQVRNESVEYTGSYSNFCTTTPEPNWLPDFIELMRKYYEFGYWERDSLHITICDTLSIDLPELGNFRGNEEAALMALYLSGELSVPENLHDRIVGDLEWIRNNEPDIAHAVDTIKFIRPWLASGLEFRYDSLLVADTTSVTFWRLICGLKHFGVEFRKNELPNVEWVSWWNGGRQPYYHPARIIDALKQVEAIKAMRAIMEDDMLDDIYPVMDSDGTIHYFFREVCGAFMYPDLWEHERFFYFRSDGTEYSYIGGFNPETDPEPPWYGMLVQARSDKFEPIVWIR